MGTSLRIGRSQGLRGHWGPQSVMLLPAAAAAVLLVLTACGLLRGGEDARVTLTVSAASDLRFAFEELGGVFTRETGVNILFNFGSTGQLAQQIEQGAPVDVFAAANVAFVEDLVSRGHILPDTQALYARGFIILWTREDSPLQLQRIEDLLQPGVQRISIANPAHAPYGVAAEQALRSAGLWDEVQSRVVFGENVNQAFQFAQTGNVDVGIIALSLGMAVDEGRYTIIPQELHSPIDQALGVVASTRHEREARSFAEFVNGPTGRPIMERYGFILPGEAQ
jgi:molybdate transport system substrate-binding protein